MNIGFISLGCPKNQVDTEIMMGEVSQSHTLTSDIERADIVVINTCGFITEAKEEAITTILDTAARLSSEQVLLVTGCLAQRYASELMQEMPEIDGLMGVGNPRQITELINSVLSGGRISLVADHPAEFQEEGPRVISTPKGWAYLKIAEGCHNRCSYCAIPSIRGGLRCRKPESIIAEAEHLSRSGCRELIIVAQDTTSYRYGSYDLAKLLEELNQVEELQWIRLMYAHPRSLTGRIIEVMATAHKVVPYLDLPIQHAADKVLYRMNRHYTQEHLKNIIGSLRSRIPHLILRTTVMVGFPGETDAEFRVLKEFVQEMKFNWLGTFTYSQEEGTDSASMVDDVPAQVKQQRQQELETIQRAITKDWLKTTIGQAVPVLIEGSWRSGIRGRTAFQAPDIDGRVLIAEADRDKYGSIIQVRLNKLRGLDLIGEIEK